MMKRKINAVKPIVLKLLQEFPETRDNDRLLQLKVWAEQFPALRYSNTKLKEFTDRYLNKTFYDPESIRRTRQKLQELHPQLRGDKYIDRHKEQEEVRQKILNWTDEQ